MKDNYLLDLAIEDEAMGFSYCKKGFDKQLFKQLIEEININNNLKLKYLAQLDFLKIENINNIINKYILEFQSSHIKVILLKQLVMNNIENKEDKIIELYNDFKQSKEYISDLGDQAPSHIYNAYDNMFSNFNNKNDKMKLLNLIKDPRDAYYLPITLKMMAHLRVEEVKDILIKFLNPAYITRKVGSIYKDELYDPCLTHIKRTLMLYSLEYLKYYSYNDVYNVIKKFEDSKDVEIQRVAQKTLRHLENKK